MLGSPVPQPGGKARPRWQRGLLDGRGISPSGHCVRPFAIDANRHQGVTLLPTSPPQPWPWSADSRGPTLGPRAAPDSAGFPVRPGVYCHKRVGVRIVANGVFTPCPPSSGALVHTGQCSPQAPTSPAISSSSPRCPWAPVPDASVDGPHPASPCSSPFRGSPPIPGTSHRFLPGGPHRHWAKDLLL